MSVLEKTVVEVKYDNLLYERVMDPLKGKIIRLWAMSLPISCSALKKILKKEFPDNTFDEFEINSMGISGISIYLPKDLDD